ncbi:uncharacterized protein LOC133647802 isoform X2 [Entelurus aequoreus]|uniref:uncharacterized protein LOC133647802 isoform X2 n=1 Tax=Entelurus aequoreus TaxID=161455 RepID=UPI002B1DF611|nr:uncharacterized protein LOC133647802 isoform X2 [Entelurus aequoreus]
MPFHLIKFRMNGDVAVVPTGWYYDGIVFWPTYKYTDRIKKAALNEEQHGPNWPKFDASVVRTCDNYKDALKIMQQYEKGCDTSDLLSEAENKELPEKRSRKAVHRLGDSDDSEEDPGNSDRASASQLHRQTPQSRRVPAVMSTQGTAVPPQLPPPPAPAALNMWQTQEPHASSLAYRPTWRGGRMADYISCSAPEMTHLFSLLEHMKQNQEQLILKISSLATVGGQDVKRVTWNILGRMFTDGVSHQINWKGVNNKKAFSRMATKTLLFSAVRKNLLTRSATDAEVTKHAIRIMKQ